MRRPGELYPDQGDPGPTEQDESGPDGYQVDCAGGCGRQVIAATQFAKRKCCPGCTGRGYEGPR